MNNLVPRQPATIIKTTKIKKGSYLVQTSRDTYKVLFSKTLKGWIVERQSDLEVLQDTLDTLSTAKLIIGEWGYF